MTRTTRWLMTAVLGCGLLGGCVQRRYVITSDPPGAIVTVNGAPLGATPVDGYFVYYGTYEFRLAKDGYETLVVQQKIPAPFYQYPPIDFFAEAVYPFNVEDVHRFHYDLIPVKQPRTDELLDAASRLRERNKTLPGDPPKPQVPPPAPMIPPALQPAPPPPMMPPPTFPGAAPSAPAPLLPQPRPVSAPKMPSVVPPNAPQDTPAPLGNPF